MEKTNIIIPNPCNANWDTMTLDDNGKYCSSCKKTVVDFTTMDVEQIKHYLDNKKNENVCGHFNSRQVIVNRPKHHQLLVDLYLKIENNFRTPILKTLTLSFIVLCMTIVGCNRPTISEELALNIQDNSTFNKNKFALDTPSPNLTQTVTPVILRQTTTGKVVRPVRDTTITYKPLKK